MLPLPTETLRCVLGIRGVKPDGLSNMYCSVPDSLVQYWVTHIMKAYSKDSNGLNGAYTRYAHEIGLIQTEDGSVVPVPDCLIVGEACSQSCEKI